MHDLDVDIIKIKLKESQKENLNNVIEINRPAVTEEILRTRYSAPVKLPSQGFILFRSSIFGFATNDYDLLLSLEAISDLLSIYKYTT